MQVTVIRIYRQFELFQQYQQRLTALVGAPQATRLVNGALYLMTLGGNDFVNNYFLAPISQRSRQYSVPEFSRYLITEFRKILLVKSLKFMNFNNINPHMYKRNLTVDTLWHAYVNGQESPIRTWVGVIPSLILCATWQNLYVDSLWAQCTSTVCVSDHRISWNLICALI